MADLEKALSQWSDAQGELDDNTFRHADGAGWYDCTLRRTAEGWRFVTVHEVWHAGEPLPHVPRGD